MNSKKRKLPKSFLESPSLSLVADFPSSLLQQQQPNELASPKGGNVASFISTHVATDAIKEIFLERLVKEIVTPFRPSKNTSKKDGKDDGGTTFVMVNGKLQKQTQTNQHPSSTQTIEGADDTSSSVWNQRLVIGTNQCHRILERNMNGDPTAPRPLLVVLARDVYPPTMLASVPVMAKRLGIEILLLPGKASNELGQALGIKKASILLLLQSESTSSPDHAKVDSFLKFVSSEMIHKPK